MKKCDMKKCYQKWKHPKTVVKINGEKSKHLKKQRCKTLRGSTKETEIFLAWG